MLTKTDENGWIYVLNGDCYLLHSHGELRPDAETIYDDQLSDHFYDAIVKVAMDANSESIRQMALNIMDFVDNQGYISLKQYQAIMKCYNYIMNPPSSGRQYGDDDYCEDAHLIGRDYSTKSLEDYIYPRGLVDLFFNRK